MKSINIDINESEKINPLDVYSIYKTLYADAMSIPFNLNADKGTKIVFLYLDDDTFIPVLNYNKEYIEIVKKWYENLNVIFDVKIHDLTYDFDLTLLSTVLNKKYPSNQAEYLLELIKNYDEYIKLQKKLNVGFKTLNVNINLDKHITDNQKSSVKYINSSVKPINSSVKPINSSVKSDYKEVDNTICINSFSMGEDYIDKTNKLKILDINVPEKIKYNNDLILLPKPIIQTNTELHLIDNNENEYTLLNTDYSFIDTNNILIQYTNILIIFNHYYLTTFLYVISNLKELNETRKIIDGITNYPEYGFTILGHLRNVDDDVFVLVKELFDNKIFNNSQSITVKLNYLAENINYLNENMNTIIPHTVCYNEETIITNYIKTNYIINNNIEDKIKASKIYDIILEESEIKNKSIGLTDSINGLRNRLSVYLHKLGLLKKRYSDGVYYYGIVNKKDLEKY